MCVWFKDIPTVSVGSIFSFSTQNVTRAQFEGQSFEQFTWLDCDFEIDRNRYKVNQMQDFYGKYLFLHNFFFLSLHVIFVFTEFCQTIIDTAK